ncbi:MAG TPA: M50 family metallopeptidase [Oligoflexia bacterium]|nr:M50 family metallopeptidase [Oligoflexia bacterium]HMP49898.1 M50 family metallopeptidase [Oligoflexia bacterium]
MIFVYYISCLSLFIAFLPVSLVLFLRELGRLVVARFLGVGVRAFVFGFGKEAGRINLAGLDFVVNLVPLGSYLEMNYSSITHFQNNNIWKKLIIFLSAPAILFSYALIFSFSLQYFFKHSVTSNDPVIGYLMKGSPASIAGLEVGDKILSVDDQPISDWSLLAKFVNDSGGKTLRFGYERFSEFNICEVAPDYNEKDNKFLVGISPVKTKVNYDLKDSLVKSVDVIKTVMGSFLNIFQKRNETPEVIFFDSSSSMQLENSFASVIRMWLLSFLYCSIWLLILSLLPIPFLTDFGNFIYCMLEYLNVVPIDIFPATFFNRIGLYSVPLWALLFVCVEIF